MHNHLADLCENWNLVVDICNGRDGPHTCGNGYERQSQMLGVLSWFTDWKKMHDTAMADDSSPTTEYNLFVDETWFYIRALILSHVSAIQIYCINKGEKVNPRNLNTDIFGWFFGDSHQSVGGSTNMMTSRQWNHAGFKVAAFRAGKYNLISNNKTGKDYFNSQQRF